jgi:hypothetical protein
MSSAARRIVFLAINASLPHAAGRASSFGCPCHVAMQRAARCHATCSALPCNVQRVAMQHATLRVARWTCSSISCWKLRLSRILRASASRQFADVPTDMLPLCASNTPRRN